MTVPPGSVIEIDCTTGEETTRPRTPEEIAASEAVPPPEVQYAGSAAVDARVTTTDDQPLEVFRFPCAVKHLYQASLTVTGIDRGNFVSRTMEGRFTWKRGNADAVMVGITVVSSLGEAASSSWAPNAQPSGTDIVFTVKGALGRTIDWLLVGSVGQFAPEGLE